MSERPYNREQPESSSELRESVIALIAPLCERSTITSITYAPHEGASKLSQKPAEAELANAITNFLALHAGNTIYLGHHAKFDGASAYNTITHVTKISVIDGRVVAVETSDDPENKAAPSTPATPTQAYGAGAGAE